MKTKLYALLASAILISQAQAGGHHGGGGNFAAAGPGPAARGGASPSIHSMPMQRFGSGRMIYPGQRFSPGGLRAPGSIEFRPHYINSTGGAPTAAHRFTSGNVNREGAIARFPNAGNTPQLRSRNNLPTTWRNHVIAQHPADWHRDWNHHQDHWWHGHRCHFFNGSWIVFDFGFNPWWPYWYYPYDYYAYGYPYPYYYQPGYYDSGYQSEGYYDQSGYANPSSNSIVAAAQQELAQQGYYRGEVDGVIGPATQRAITRYQSNHDLRVTGALTPDTLQALRLQRVASY